MAATGKPGARPITGSSRRRWRSKGFVAVLPDYRLYPAVTFPAFVDDGALVVRWARDNVARFGGNPDRLT